MSEKKYVLVTGVSSGIGYDAVRFLTGKGYYVFGSVRKEVDQQRLNSEFTENFTCLLFDVTKKNEVAAAASQVKEILGKNKLTGLVNNAGLALAGPLELMDDEKFRYQIEVNLFSVRTVTNIFLPFLKGDKAKNITGGKIIMISSINGIFNTPFNGAYCISKHAMESLSEVYRRELMMYNIDVVSIQPGPIQSNIWEKNIDQYSEFEHTAYATMTRKFNEAAKHAQRQALPAERISKLIFKILTRKTKLHFVVNKNRLITEAFVKYMPARWVDKILYNRLIILIVYSFVSI